MELRSRKLGILQALNEIKLNFPSYFVYGEVISKGKAKYDPDIDDAQLKKYVKVSKPMNKLEW